jgi:hypothetical protein
MVGGLPGGGSETGGSTGFGHWGRDGRCHSYGRSIGHPTAQGDQYSIAHPDLDPNGHGDGNGNGRPFPNADRYGCCYGHANALSHRAPATCSQQYAAPGGNGYKRCARADY